MKIQSAAGVEQPRGMGTTEGGGRQGVKPVEDLARRADDVAIPILNDVELVADVTLPTKNGGRGRAAEGCRGRRGKGRGEGDLLDDDLSGVEHLPAQGFCNLEHAVVAEFSEEPRLGTGEVLGGATGEELQTVGRHGNDGTRGFVVEVKGAGGREVVDGEQTERGICRQTMEGDE